MGACGLRDDNWPGLAVQALPLVRASNSLSPWYALTPFSLSCMLVYFSAVKGIYFSWSSDPPNAKIKDWNVSELKIDQNRRHVDKAVVASFWKVLDTWMMANKPGLMPK